MALLSTPQRDSWIIGIISLILFVPFIGWVPLFDWDEINFAEAAREMYVTSDYLHVQINYTTFWEKPPFFFWLQVLSMKVFGVSDFAARLPNAWVGVVTLITLYHMGRSIVNVTFGRLWALVYAGSILPHFYFRTGIIDPVFNLFIFLSLYFAFRSVESIGSKTRTYYILAAGIASGMSILTKGPVGLLDFLLVMGVMMIIQRTFWLWRLYEWGLFLFVAALPFMAWLSFELVQHGPFFLVEFIVYQIRLFQTQDAGHGGPFIYHWVVILFGCFPMSFIALRAWNKSVIEGSRAQSFWLWSVVSFFVVLVLFSIVKTKIAHYSSFCYLPLSYLATTVVYRWWNGIEKIRPAMLWSIALFGSVVALVLIAFPIVMTQWETLYPILIPYNKDPFAAANFTAPVYWSGWEACGGALYWILLLSAILYFKRNTVVAIVLLFISGISFHETVLPTILPKIERYVQGEVIDFYKSKVGEKAYVEVVHFKSYAHLYYTQKAGRSDSTYKKWVARFPADTTPPAFIDWLRYYHTDAPVYFVTKVGREKDLEEDSSFVRIGGQHGYCFYRKK